MAHVPAVDREKEIVAAAIRVLSRAGVAGATTRAVAAEAGIPLGTLHYVFPSKDRMLMAVVDAVADEVLDTVRRGMDPGRGVAHALRHGVSTFWETLVEDRVGLQIMQYELAMYSARRTGAGDSGSLGRSQVRRYTGLVGELCEQAARAAGERCAVDADTLGRLLLAVLDGLVVQYVADPDAGRARRDLDRATAMLVGYADPRPIGAPIPS
ncbi:TetR/AcrR family transcriptional regulator [Pseudonocardia kongjuensis]|uniref:TetR/AcrR family transcriptional regulator n=1 Tax=Pseudonocardia kongjuensis TaxID=102227 RepID=A0ABN1XNW1_9PSEU